MTGEPWTGWLLVGAIALMTVITLLTRAFPFLVYSHGRRPSPLVLYLGRVLPPAIIALLVVYCLKDIDFSQGGRGIPEALACLTVVLLQRWRKNAMLSIGLGTVLYMVLIQMVF